MGRKRESEDWLTEDEIPSSDDVRWERWSSSVYTLLETPRSARELAELLPDYSHPLITNTLCWLDVHERVDKDASKRPVLWRKKPPAAPPEPPPELCPRCAGALTVTLVGVSCALCGRQP